MQLMRERSRSIINSGMPNSSMRRSAKVLVATAALAVSLTTAALVGHYKWSRHKEDVMVVQKQEKKEEKPALQAVPIRTDAGVKEQLEKEFGKGGLGTVTGGKLPSKSMRQWKPRPGY